MFKNVLLIFSAITAIECANILAVFPTPSISHQVVFRALTDALEDRGHTLTIVSTDPERTSRRHPNTTEIDMHFTYESFRRALSFVQFKETKMDELDLMEMSMKLFEPMITEQFEHPKIVKLLKSRDKVKFDVVIVEYLNQIPWYAVAEWFDSPLIGITSLDTINPSHAAHGNDAHPIAHPEMLFPFIENLTFEQRYRVLRFELWSEFYYNPIIYAMMDKLVQRFTPGVKTSAKDLVGKADLLLVNAHPALGFLRPILPSTVQLGFMHIKPPKEITDAKLKKFVDESDKPIIYMSLGSNVQASEMDESFVNVFLNTFKSLPYNVLWKWETDTMKNKPDNVFIHKWLPQADLLAHPKIKLFITQGGQQSFEEAVDRKVPLIVVPFTGEQESNALRAVKLKIGLHLELFNLNEKVLSDAIGKIISGDFKENIAKLREIVYDEPMRPVEKAVWWVEYCIRHKGTKHFDYSGKYIPFYQRYFLDFIAIDLVILWIAIKLLKFMLKIVFGKKEKSKTE